ncbi:helix-turn-helix domain-containing protein [Novosphingobium sp. G106]|uniref:helix-turn-helix domain-containing protein n=1 Tax=Novosphingobium sp. G106 TaxID=2849500 RepID=UPI0020C4640E|nr:helix-turn-helix transcriptional regulator [Novosphingobium sp. G106]
MQQDFSHQLRTLREAQGLSVRALASLVGVSSVTIWKWEKGDSRPRPRLMTPLARALDVSPQQLQPRMTNGEMHAKPAEAEAEDREGSSIQPTTEGLTSAPVEALSEVIARAKQMIADASGTGPKNITILIEY